MTTTTTTYGLRVARDGGIHVTADGRALCGADGRGGLVPNSRDPRDLDGRHLACRRCRKARQYRAAVDALTAAYDAAHRPRPTVGYIVDCQQSDDDVRYVVAAVTADQVAAMGDGASVYANPGDARDEAGWLNRQAVALDDPDVADHGVVWEPSGDTHRPLGDPARDHRWGGIAVFASQPARQRAMDWLAHLGIRHLVTFPDTSGYGLTWAAHSRPVHRGADQARRARRDREWAARFRPATR